MKPLALALMLLPGAFGQKVEREFDPSVNFAKFKTFTIRDGRVNTKNPTLSNDLVRKRIEFDIQKQLQAKGLIFAASGPVDLNVFYTFGAVRASELEAYPAGWGGWRTRVVRVPFTEGTLVLDLRDAGTKALVWRTVARQDKGNAVQLEGKIDDMVKESIDKYPPKGK